MQTEIIPDAFLDEKGEVVIVGSGEFYRVLTVDPIAPVAGPAWTPLYPARKLEIEEFDGRYWIWMDCTGDDRYTFGPRLDHPFAAADWCERNGFAWEVAGSTDPLAELAKWRAAQ